MVFFGYGHVLGDSLHIIDAIVILRAVNKCQKIFDEWWHLCIKILIIAGRI